MTPTRITFLLPGHGWEELASVDDAPTAQLVSRGFTALWHPQLIAAVGQAPRLQPVHDLDRQLRQELVVIPAFARHSAEALHLEAADNVMLALSDPATSRDEIVS
ncbi:MAG: hypothetical protein AAGF97_14840, partial [Planctomycetota bacterium]